MTMIKTNESGRSMIEMLGVLAIIGVLSVGGIAGYSKAMNKFKTNKVADNVSMLVANIKTLYAQQNSYNGLDVNSAISMGVVPDELVSARPNESGTGGALTNAYNGHVYINAASSVGGDTSDDLAFYIIFTGLSKEACITLATNDWGSGFSSGLIGLQAVSGKDDAEAHTNTDVSDIKMGCDGGDSGIACAGKTVPMDVADAATACNCDEGNTCSIFWKYY